MTVFWREGFMRIGPSGDYHEVAGHWVRRDEWDRGSSATSATRSYYLDILREAKVLGTSSAAFVSPNAECPVCGRFVFFFQNTYGSRVFFDELGPPWPKHPCTDNSATSICTNEGQDIISPTIRTSKSINEITWWLENAEVCVEDEFVEKYGLARWTMWIIAGRFHRGRDVFLVLEAIEEATSRRLFFAQKSVGRCYKVGTTVYQFRDWLICFDLDSMKPIELEFQRLKGASDFVEKLTSFR